MDVRRGAITQRTRHRIIALWAATWTAPIAAQFAFASAAVHVPSFDAPEIRFVAVTALGIACVLAATSLVARSFRTSEAELATFGVFLLAASTMLLVHGVTTPGVVFDANNGHALSLLAAVPFGVLMALPLLRRRPDALARLGTTWKTWVAGAFILTSLSMMGLLAAAGFVPEASPGRLVPMAIAVEAVIGAVVISRRHLHLASNAGQLRPLLPALGVGLVASSSAVWFAPATFDVATSMASSTLALGVLFGVVGTSVAYRRTATFELIAAPVLATEPISALAVSADPIVRQLVADLDGKDRETREHVIRTRDLALGVGRELRLSGHRLRDLALAALLHDIGKVGLPEEILNKTGRLTPEEFAMMQQHVEVGEAMIADSPAIASVAPIVRSHHERVDGRGYPDGLCGTEIPQSARILAVCDAYDAMANSRRYRAGMGHDKAVSILREHAGSQWDPVVVEALVMFLTHSPMVEELHVQIDAVGRDLGVELLVDTSSSVNGIGGHFGCDCLPDSVLDSIERDVAEAQRA